MEVHHHPHHSNSHSKNWREYFFEFFMLFFAVFCGFLVENYREHHVENERADRLAQSLFADMKRDTAALNQCTDFSNQKIKNIDSLIELLHQPRERWNDSTLFRYQNFSTRINAFDPTLGTYDQLKSSGSLRYFDQHLVDLLNAYDVQSKKTASREATDLKMIIDDFWPFITKIVNFEAGFDVRFNQKISHEIYVAPMDDNTRRQWINYIVLSKWIRRVTMNEYEKQYKIANDILIELNKEFHLN